MADDDYYVRQGLILMLNYVAFSRDHPWALERREGSDSDAENVYNTFSELGFRFYSPDFQENSNSFGKAQKYGLRNGTTQETTNLLQRLLDDFDALENCDCFVLVIASHGNIKQVATSDGCLDIASDIILGFDKCTCLRGKPKIFFIQACRENYNDSDNNNFKEGLTFGFDIYLGYPTISGKLSYRDTISGSWYLQTLCKSLDDNGRKFGLNKIMMDVNRKVGDKGPQCTSVVSQLRHEVRFYPGYPFMLHEVPKFDSYFERKVEEVAILEGIKAIPTKGGFFFVDGGGGMGKSTLVSHVVRNTKNHDYFFKQCRGLTIAVWLNCYTWKDGLYSENIERKFKERLLSMCKQVHHLVSRSERNKPKKFSSISHFLMHYMEKGQRILFILDDVADSSILRVLDSQSPTPLCCVITRDADKLKENDFNPLIEGEISNMLTVGYLVKEQAVQIFRAKCQNFHLSEDSLQTLANHSCGHPLLVSMICGKLNNITDTTIRAAIADLSNERIGATGTMRGEKTAADLFRKILSEFPAEITKKYYTFLLFDPMDPVELGDLMALWQIDQVEEAKAICDQFEKANILIRSFGSGGLVAYHVNSILYETAKNTIPSDEVIDKLKFSKQRIQICTQFLKMEESCDMTHRLSVFCRKLITSDKEKLLQRILAKLATTDFLTAKRQEIAVSYVTDKVLLIAAETGHVKIVEHFYSTWNLKTREALMLACENGHLAVVKFLNKQCRKATWPKSNGYSTTLAMIYAAKSGNIDLVTFLYKLKPGSISAADSYGWTPILMACVEGHLELVRFFIEKDPETVTLDAIRSACIDGRLKAVAFKHSFVEVLKLLAKKKPEVLTQRDNYDQSLMTIACETGFTEVVEYLAEYFPETVRQSDEKGRTALMVSCQFDNLQILTILAKKEPFLLSQSDNKRQLPIHVACKRGNLSIVDFVATNAPNLAMQCDSKGRTPLMLACQRNYVDIVELLARRFPEGVTIADLSGMTALMYACMNGHLDCVKMLARTALCAVSCAVSQTDKFGVCPFVFAYRSEQIAILEFLLDEMPDELSRPMDNGDTLLLFALRNNRHIAERKLAFELMIRKPSLIMVPNSAGITPMMFACQHGMKYDWWIRKMADVEPRSVRQGDNNGKTPLMYALENKHISVIKFLVETFSETVWQKDTDGLTTLMYAAKAGDLESVVLLVEKAPELLMEIDKDGDTALTWATQFCYSDLIKYLVEKFPNSVLLGNKYGRTPMIHACQIGLLDAVKILAQNAPRSVTMADAEGKTPAMHALENNTFEIAEFLEV